MPLRTAEKTQLQALCPPPPKPADQASDNFRSQSCPPALGYTERVTLKYQIPNRSGPLTVFVPISKPGASRRW